MATSTPSKPAGNQRSTPPPKTTGGLSSGRIVAIVVGAVLAIAAVVGIMAALDNGGSDEGSGSGIEQTRPVNIDGTALPAMPEDPTAADPGIGLAIPTVEGASFDGTPVRIGAGEPTLSVYLAHWCPHCQREVPVLVQWQASGDVPAGLDVIGIATSTTPDRPNYPPSTWLEGEQWPWPTLADSGQSEAAQAAGLTGFPYMVLSDADGKVVWRHSGEISAEELSAAIAQALPELTTA
jgi:thiol-disulfide isomerase/thioredoxin